MISPYRLTLPRPPFRMTPSRPAKLRRDGKFVIGGKASFVWETFLQLRVSGVPGVYEISGPGPWHRVDCTMYQAEDALRAWYGNGVLSPGPRIARLVSTRNTRRARGLEVG